MSAIHIHNLSKRYPNKPTPALNNLNLTVERGEIFGYLGSNGAGKTTTIRIMLDLIRPTSGRVHMLGMDAQQDATKIKHHVGNLPGELTLWPHLTGQHTLHYLANLRPGCDLTYAFQLAERLHLDLIADKVVLEFTHLVLARPPAGGEKEKSGEVGRSAYRDMHQYLLYS